MNKWIWAALIGAVIVIGGTYMVATGNSDSGTSSAESGEELASKEEQNPESDKPELSETSSADAVKNKEEGTSTGQMPADKGDLNISAGEGQNTKPNADSGEQQEGGTVQDNAVVTAADPDSITVLVNKTHGLPSGYEPDDLVYPDVPFIFSELTDKRKMRREAADALKLLFDGAKKDGIELAGVSGYRSEARQKTLFNNYVERDGLEAASRYSARPGFSEHQTGLAMDVSGRDGRCAAEACFAETDEAKWLAKHAYEYGFIIRYPEDKEEITGYMYEAWHLRYVGTDAAAAIQSAGLTLEEYIEQQ
ncbi:M15 family metallopeptidase [Paenibacillus xylaniclasticus]|uniref:M15 family metallopeptidase n=1 Tax=Paenibacillus xylaniclasticus TaxID=588083 RepID=UPI0017745E42|nr:MULTISPECIES: M15 family metallopeptidase [Paenibacillus]GFN31553.1 putative carboxypeptidase YodJ [Paenibacillus curdlanolyticus]